MARVASPALVRARAATRNAQRLTLLARAPETAVTAANAWLVAEDAWLEVDSEASRARAEQAATHARDLIVAADNVRSLIETRTDAAKLKRAEDPNLVHVVFRTWKDSEADGGYSVTDGAILDTFHRGTVTLFTSQGHAEVDYFPWVNRSRRSIVYEYDGLLRAMRRVGYRVVLAERLPSGRYGR